MVVSVLIELLKVVLMFGLNGRVGKVLDCVVKGLGLFVFFVDGFVFVVGKSG